MYMGGNRDPQGFGCGIILMIIMVILLVGGCSGIVSLFLEPFNR